VAQSQTNANSTSGRRAGRPAAAQRPLRLPLATDGTTRNAIPPTYQDLTRSNATGAATVPGGIYLPVNQSDDWG